MILFLLVAIIIMAYKLIHGVKTIPVRSRNFTTGIGNESDTINRAVDQNSENVNNGFLSSKTRAPCPFLVRRGWCVKGNQCDFSHENFPKDVKGRSKSSLDKRSVPSPFLQRKGFCLRPTSCDFLPTAY